MGWHDSLAVRAIAMGKTATDFHRGAQNKANAAWLFLVVAGVVWYFVDWRWALIPVAIAAFSALQSVSATLVATRLEKVQRPG